MSYRIGHAYHDDTIRVVLSGSVDDRNIDRLADDVIALSRQRPIKRLLIDVRALSDEVDAFKVVELVDRYPAEGRMHRVAVIEEPSQARQHQFHETVAQNRGYRLRHFTDAAEAVTWLNGTGQ